MANELTVQQKMAKDIQGAIFSKGVLEQIKMALPDIGVTPERLARTAFTSIMKDPKLLRCTTQSLIRSLILSAQYGLLLDGRTAHLVPYGPECTFIMDYKGMCVLIRRNPSVADVWAEVVYSNDEFHAVFGCERSIDKHTPYYILSPDAEPGKMVMAYAVIKYKDGTFSFVIMPRSEIEHIRDTYGNPNSKMWKNDPAEAWKKTAIRRIAKTADLDPVTAAAIQMSDEGKDQRKLFAEQQIMTGAAIDLTSVMAALSEPDEGDEEAQAAAAESIRSAFAATFTDAAAIEFSRATAAALDKTDIEVMQMAIDEPVEFAKALAAWKAKAAAAEAKASSNTGVNAGASAAKHERTQAAVKAEGISEDQARVLAGLGAEHGVTASAIKRYCNEQGFFTGKAANLTDINAQHVDAIIGWIEMHDLPGETDNAPV